VIRIVVVLAPLVLAACVATQSPESGTSVASTWSCSTDGLLGNSSAVEHCAFGESEGWARVAAAARDDEAATGRESAGTSQGRRGSLFSGRQDVGTAGALDMIRTITPLR
jgi:hypothetical protein